MGCLNKPVNDVKCRNNKTEQNECVHFSSLFVPNK